ncbi:MAG: hypothetical protein Q4G67_11405 [Actinomycetia bacterium]|nr:hypothetical protein [Actinomycetes bacterium]
MPPVKKIIVWILVIFFLYAILTSPGSAANIVNSIWEIIYNGIRNIFSFFNALLTGSEATGG